MAATVLNTTANLNGKTLMTLEVAETITALKTFDRDPAAPFAVTSGSAKVTNLDADKLDGYEAAQFAALAENETITADWTFNDSVKVTLGTGGDADLYYDGTHVYLNTRVVGSGDFRILGGGLTIPATAKLYLDGGTHTYITESSDNVIQFWGGNSLAMTIGTGSVDVASTRNLSIAPTLRFYLDGGGDTYILEYDANRIGFYSGGSLLGLWNATGLDIRATNLYIPATGKVYLDGGGDTYIYESVADRVDLYTGGAYRQIWTTTYSQFPAINVIVDATKKVYLDGGGDTWIAETSANVIDLIAGTTEANAVQIAGGNLRIKATNRLYFDGGDDTYVSESSANVITFVAGASARLALGSISYFTDCDVTLAATKKLYFDGGGDTYIQESSANTLIFVVGGTTRLTLDTTNWALSPAFVATSGFTMATWPTTASAANAWVGNGDYLRLSTSTLKAKTNLQDISAEEAARVVMSLRPITYTSAIPTDDQTKRWAGFGAEDVEKVDPTLVTYDKDGSPNYVTYDRVPAYLVAVIQEQQKRIELLESRLGN